MTFTGLVSSMIHRDPLPTGSCISNISLWWKYQRLVFCFFSFYSETRKWFASDIHDWLIVFPNNSDLSTHRTIEKMPINDRFWTISEFESRYEHQDKRSNADWLNHHEQHLVQFYFTGARTPSDLSFYLSAAVIACSRLRDSRVRWIEKAQTRK